MLLRTISSAKSKTDSDTEQLAHFSPDEMERLKALAERVAAADKLDGKELLVLSERPKAADIAMFGRMLADNPKYNVEAAAQVAHAFTTHRAVVEDDYFTAVDELKAERKEADKGAGFRGRSRVRYWAFLSLHMCQREPACGQSARRQGAVGQDRGGFIEALAQDKPFRQAEQLRQPRACTLRPGGNRARSSRAALRQRS